MHKNISVRGSNTSKNLARNPTLGFNYLSLIAKVIFKRFKSELGSISVVVIGLFVITVASLMVMTDVSALIVAKRSLVKQLKPLHNAVFIPWIRASITKVKEISLHRR